MKKNIRLVSAAVAVLLPLLAACGEDEAREQVSTKEELKPVTLTLNWYPYGEHAPFYYGLDKGIFAEHGIDLTIQAGQGSGKTVSAVGGKQTDFGWADTPALMAAVDKGVKARSVGVFLQTTPAAVQFFADAGIDEPADLKGKSVASTAGDALSKTFPAFLQANGLSEGDVNIQNTDGAGKIAAVISGRTDALLGFAHDQGPTIAAKAKKPVSYLRFSEYGVQFLSNGLVAHDDLITSDPDLVRDMVAATSKAFEAAVENPKEAVAAMEGASQQLPAEEVLIESWEATAELLHTDATKGEAPGVNAEQDWSSTIEVFTEAGTIKGGHSASDFWSAEFAPGS